MTDGPTGVEPVVMPTAGAVAPRLAVPPPAPPLPDGRPNGLLAMNPGLTADDLAAQAEARRGVEHRP